MLGGDEASALTSQSRPVIAGTASFEEVEKSQAFIDKTMLIKELLESGNKVTLITCPKRFGKSTNMNMIRTFLEMKVDENGQPIEDCQNTVEYKLFMNKKIARKEPELFDKNFGQYPVISVDFSTVKGADWNVIREGIKSAILQAFKHHEWLYKISLMEDILSYEKTSLVKKTKTFNEEVIKGKLRETEEYFKNNNLSALKNYAVGKRIAYQPCTETLRNFYRWKWNTKKEEESALRSSLKTLSEFLSKRLGKKVCILIDEYDLPMQHVIANNVAVKDVQKNLVEDILSQALRGNEDNLHLGVMTGVSSMVKGSPGSGLNNVMHYSFLGNHNLAKFYGFTEEEISQNFKLNGKNLENLKKWYNGYVVKGQRLTIYNPWSVISCIQQNFRFASYWEKTGAIDSLKKLFTIKSIKKEIEELLENKKKKILINTSLTVEEVKNLQNILSCKTDEERNKIINSFFSFLFEHGYLSYFDKESSTLEVRESIPYFKIPNKEIRTEFENNIIECYIETNRLNPSDLEAATEALLRLFKNNNNEIETLTKNISGLGISSDIQESGMNEDPDIKRFQEKLTTLFSKLDISHIRESETGVHGNENLYHSVINVIAIKSGLKVGSEIWMPDRKGRADVVLIDQESEVGVIIEVKYVGSAGKALEQAEDYTILNHIPGIKTIKYLGVNVKRDQTVIIKSKIDHNPKMIHPAQGGSDKKPKKKKRTQNK